MKLDKRLKTIAAMVRPGSVVADIGCDHGYLVCDLVARRVCPRGYACDIGAGPLARAQKTVEAEGLERRVRLIRANGLLGLPPAEVRDIVIAGMGGEAIASIILGVPWTCNSCYRFILQPMSKAGHLRRVLCENGFSVLEERAVMDGKFVYTVMAVMFTGKRVSPPPLFVWAGRHFESDRPESGRYLHRVSNALFKRAAGLDAAHREKEAASLAALGNIIRERAEELCL